MLELLFSVILSVFALNGCVVGGYLCKKGKTNCHSPDSPSPEIELWTPSFEEERYAMMNSSVCTDDFEKERSVCSVQPSLTHVSNESTVFKSRNCFCDEDCHNYHDCCVDYAVPKDVENGKDFSCTHLPNVNNGRIYTVQKCAEKWEGDFVRSLCEEEAVSLQKKGKHFTHLQAIPVHSMWTNLFYRNVYCAVCNGDIQLTTWKTYIHCSGHDSHDNIETDTEIFISENATYNPVKNNWRDKIGNITRNCRLVVKELIAWENLLKTYRARRCKPAIDTCPPGTSSYQIQKCQAYTSYVYEKESSNGKLKAIYKNFHCAVCNKVTVKNLICWDPTDLLVRSDPPFGRLSFLPLLFDINIDDQQGNQVGASHSVCSLRLGQIWDPILRSCLNVTCGREFKRKGSKCVRITEEGTDTDCLRVAFTSDKFVVMDNSSIYVNYSRRFYQKDQYQVSKEVSGTLLEVLVCADEEQVVFFPGLAWLSEITLSVSIACLTVHLIIYAMLPKLRNRPGKILMSLSLSLLCGHLFFLLGPSLKHVHVLCQVFGIITHYAYLSSFCWMSVMAFDIYSTFTASTTRSSSRDSTFLRYSVFGWLTSLLIVTVAIIVDNTTSENAFKPKYGSVICWINQKIGLLVFFGVPVAVLLLANLVFFVFTAVSIRRVSKQTRMVNKFSEKVRYYLYIKLAVVLGLTWLFGFLASALRIGALWYPFVILNGLQGALIFIVFTVKRKIMHMLSVKLKLRSHKYKLSKDSAGKKILYSSLSNLTTSTMVTALGGSPEILKAVRRIESKSSTTKL